MPAGGRKLHGITLLTDGLPRCACNDIFGRADGQIATPFGLAMTFLGLAQRQYWGRDCRASCHAFGSQLWLTAMTFLGALTDGLPRPPRKDEERGQLKFELL
jgi:hypothetical protein